MSGTIVGDGELLRRALRWIGERRREQPQIAIGALLEEAGIRFNLSPQQAEWLLHTLGAGGAEG